jgi:serine/threonine protein kinase
MTYQPLHIIIANEIASKLGFSDVRFVGNGVFKETYCVLTHSKVQLALKILKPEKSNVDRTKREISAMLKCNSPYLARLHFYEVYRDSQGKEFIYFIEDFYDGGTLTDKLRKGKLDIGTVKTYAKCFCGALEELKNKNLVHRDIKPDNIMFKLTSDEPSIVDFGLVRDLADVSLTQTWAPMGPGTPLFASPEQLNNDKQLIKWRSDQFAIGLVLGLCLTGQHPFQDSNMDQNQVVDRMAKREKCSVAFVAAARRSGLEGLVKMISPWPVQRFSTLTEILEIFN